MRTAMVDAGDTRSFPDWSAVDCNDGFSYMRERHDPNVIPLVIGSNL